VVAFARTYGDHERAPARERHRSDAGGESRPVREPLDRGVDRDRVHDPHADRAERVQQVQLPERRRVRESDVPAAGEQGGEERERARTAAVAPTSRRGTARATGRRRKRKHRAERRQGEVEALGQRLFDRRPDVLVGAHRRHHPRGGDDLPPAREAEDLGGSPGVVDAVVGAAVDSGVVRLRGVVGVSRSVTVVSHRHRPSRVRSCRGSWEWGDRSVPPTGPAVRVRTLSARGNKTPRREVLAPRRREFGVRVSAFAVSGRCRSRSPVAGRVAPRLK